MGKDIVSCQPEPVRPESSPIPILSYTTQVIFYFPDDGEYVVQHNSSDIQYIELVGFKPHNPFKLMKPVQEYLKECGYQDDNQFAFSFLGRERHVVCNGAMMYDQRSIFTGMKIDAMTLGRMFARNHRLALYTYDQLLYHSQDGEIVPGHFEALLLYQRILTEPHFVEKNAPFNNVFQQTHDQTTSDYLSTHPWTPSF